MKKELRKVVAVLMSVVMLISNVPVTALADWWTDSSAGAPFAIGAQPYAAGYAEEYSIFVGDSETVFSSKSSGLYENHKWKVDDPSGLTVSANGASATVTGLKAGNYTLTHTYDYFQMPDTERFLIHVQGITVSFDLNGGSGYIAPIAANADGYVTLPDVPAWQGHVFKGWTMPGSDTIYTPGQTIQVTADLTMTARWAAKVTLRFDLNGGSGTTPATIYDESGETIELPYGTDLSLSEHTFLGWSPKKDAITLESDNTKAEIYPAGELYQLTADTTLYAVWARADGTQGYKLCIAVRRDGTIPGEPANHSWDSYVELFNDNVDNVVNYFSPLQTVYGEDVVMRSLKEPFWDLVNDNLGKLAKTRVAFDPETQEIVFYVIKLQAVSKAWHVDGVIRDKAMVHLNYNGNGYTAGLVPDSEEMAKGDSATIAQPGNYKEANQTGWLDLARSGYTFDGWNTAADGSGTSYQPGTTIQVNNNITLYAQWKPNIHGITYKFVGTYPQDAILPRPNRAVHQGTMVQKPQNPTSADAAYVFEGWTTPANVQLNGTTYAMPDEDVVWVG